MRERFGVRIAAGYGLTETAGTICLDDPLDPLLNTVGRPLGDTELRLVDDEGDEAEQGDPAEIWVRGPSVFSGYVGAFADVPALTPDGWYRTGDVGVLADDGRLMIVDRLKDVIIVGGFNVTPSEVEDVLLDASDGLGARSSSARPTTAPASASWRTWCLAPVPTVDTAVLISHCADHVARYKVPARIELRDDLPTTNTGKTVRRLLS